MHAWRGNLVRLLGGLARPLQAGATGLSSLAAGLLTRADLEAAIARLWDDLGDQDSGDAPGWHEWESAFYRPQLEPGARVLLVGCGSGRDLVPLLQAGHAAEGVAPRAIEACRRRLARMGLEAPLHVGSIENVRFASRFDLAIFSWLCYGYIPESRARVKALANLRTHLAEAGRVLISYVRRQPPPSRSGWTPEYGDLLLVTRERAGVAVHIEHHFAPEEIEAEARAAGLTVAEHVVAGHGKLVLRSA